MSILIESKTGLAISEQRHVWQSIARGLAGRCPACGRGAIYTSFLKVAHSCKSCGTELHHHRADDAPPYFTMLIVGHVVVGGALSLERILAPSELLHLALWIPLTLGLSLWLLPRIKGGLIGLQWALRMHGFGSGPDPVNPEPISAAAPASHQNERG